MKFNPGGEKQKKDVDTFSWSQTVGFHLYYSTPVGIKQIHI